MDIVLVGGSVAALTSFLALSSTMISSFQKCGPNQAMIISGLGTQTFDDEGNCHEFKIIKGGGAVVWPVIQERRFLSLEVMTIDIRPETPAITSSGIPIFFDCVAHVKVRGDNLSIATAAEHFLNKDESDIKTISQEILVGHLRAVVGQMEIQELIGSFGQFARTVQDISMSDLNKMGLTVVSFTVRELKDDVGYLAARGGKRVAEVNRNVGNDLARLNGKVEAESSPSEAYDDLRTGMVDLQNSLKTMMSTIEQLQTRIKTLESQSERSSVLWAELPGHE